MLNKNVLFVILLLLSFFFQMGGTEAREQKALFFSKFVFFPFINSLNSIFEIIEVKEENIQLANALARKQIEIVKLQNALHDQENIKVQFETDQTEFILANVIAYSGNSQEKNLIVNKGSKDGVEKGFPVISTNGIVGKVVIVSRNYSVVLPFNHSTFRLGVMLKRNSLQGLLKSDIYGNVAMTMLRQASDINVGDTLITSDISSIFPKGFPIGVVNNIQPESDGVNMKAMITPFEVIGQLDQIIIVNYKKDISYEEEIDNSK